MKKKFYFHSFVDFIKNISFFKKYFKTEIKKEESLFPYLITGVKFLKSLVDTYTNEEIITIKKFLKDLIEIESIKDLTVTESIKFLSKTYTNEEIMTMLKFLKDLHRKKL